MLKNITQFTTCDLPAACQSLTRVINKTLGHNKSVIHFIITAHPFFWIFFDLLFPVFFLERIHSFMYISTFFSNYSLYQVLLKKTRHCRSRVPELAKTDFCPGLDCAEATPTRALWPLFETFVHIVIEKNLNFRYQ